MVDELPGPPEPQRARWAHGWYPYHDYLSVHYSYMDRLEREGLVLRDELSFIDISGWKGERIQVQLTGWIDCAHDVRIFVDKWMDVGVRDDGRESVRSYSYSYHACFRDGREILRYDSAHGLADLHRHRIDPITGLEVREKVVLDDLPTLDGAIREALELAQAILENGG